MGNQVFTHSTLPNCSHLHPENLNSGNSWIFLVYCKRHLMSPSFKSLYLFQSTPCISPSWIRWVPLIFIILFQLESQDAGHCSRHLKSDINFIAKWKYFSVEINETSLRELTEAQIPSFNCEIQLNCHSRQMKLVCNHWWQTLCGVEGIASGKRKEWFHTWHLVLWTKEENKNHRSNKSCGQGHLGDSVVEHLPLA